MKKVISPNAIKQAIVEEAFKMKRKQEIFVELQKMNAELQKMNEHSMVGSFGFQTPADNMNKTKTGFVNDFQNISHIAALAAEFAEADKATVNEDVVNEELSKLKEEIKKLQEENAALKKITNK